MQLQDKVGDDSKISSASSDSPEEVFIFGRVHGQDFARGSDQGNLYGGNSWRRINLVLLFDSNLNQVVNCQPMLSCEPTKTTSENHTDEASSVERTGHVGILTLHTQYGSQYRLQWPDHVG